MVLRVLIIFSKDCLVNSSGELFNRQHPISRRVEVSKDLSNLFIRKHHALDFREEVVEFLKVKLAVAVFVSQLHPVQRELLHIVYCEALARDLLIEGAEDCLFLRLGYDQLVSLLFS